MSFDNWYAHYPHKVSRGAAVKAWDKLKPDAELEKQMILALDAQKRYRKEAKSSGEFMPNWCGPAVWLNDQRWLDGIPSHSKLKEKAAAKICSTKNCSNETHGPKFNKCVDHLPDSWEDFRRQKAREKGLTKEDIEKTQTLGIGYLKSIIG